MLCYRCGSHVLDGSPVCETCGQKFTVRTRHPSRAKRPRQPDSSSIPGGYQPGDRIADRYEIKGVAGQGPIGVVYRAIDREVDVEVAVKVITPKLIQSEEERRILQSEARLIRALSHIGCVKVYEDGFEGDRPYLVMQYLEGLSLRRIIDLRHGKGYGFSLEEVKPIFEQLLAVLSYAHRFKHGDKIGVAHGHVKPQNVVVLPDVLKLVDFREACFIPRVPYVAAQRVRGGEANYIAPEVVEGREVTPLADLYGLGMLLWEMLAGHEDSTSDTMDLSVIEGIPRTMDMVFRRLVAERPEDRYQKITEVLDDFEAALDGRVPPHASVRKPLTLVPRRAQVEMPEYLASGEFNLVGSSRSPSGEPDSFDSEPDLGGDIQLGEDEVEEIVDADELGFSVKKKGSPSLPATSKISAEDARKTGEKAHEPALPPRPTLEVLEESEEEHRSSERTRRERKPSPTKQEEKGSQSPARETEGRVALPIGAQAKAVEGLETEGLVSEPPSESATDPEMEIPPELREDEEAAFLLDSSSRVEKRVAEKDEGPSAAEGELEDEDPGLKEEGDSFEEESGPKVEKKEPEQEEASAAADSASRIATNQLDMEDVLVVTDSSRIETKQLDREEVLAAAAKASRLEKERIEKKTPLATGGPLDNRQGERRKTTRPITAKDRGPFRFVAALVATAFLGLVLAVVISEDMRSALGLSAGPEAPVEHGDQSFSNGETPPTRPIGGKEAGNGDGVASDVEPSIEDGQAKKEEERAPKAIEPSTRETEDASLAERAQEPDEPEPARTKAQREVEKQPVRAAPAKTRPAPTRPAAQETRVKKAETQRPPDSEPTERVQKVAAIAPEPAAVDPRGRCPAGMVFVASGTFRMGSAINDPMRNLGEKALTDVQVEAYCIDRYEYGGTGREPQTGVTWYQAKELCEARGRRLCTEEEWERACKGPRNLRFPYGNSFDPDACNTEDADGNPREVAEAGAFERCRSGFGVLDMSGNVAEWTSSRFQEGRQDRTYKGGAANRPDWDARCAARGNRSPTARDRYLGFRCCGDPL